MVTKFCTAWSEGDWWVVVGYILLGILAAGVFALGKWLAGTGWIKFIKGDYEDGTPPEDK
jgi:hypothetical protein